jgi:NhaP-type Na+/H+ or K+/H+ antiporter
VNADPYETALALIGAAALFAAWLPAYLAHRPLSLPIILIGVGVVVGVLGLGLPAVDPLRVDAAAERLTELGVIVALMGAGLRIDRPVSWRGWATCWRLVAVAMPLTIGATALLGGWVGGFAMAPAVLLGAVLAPTDPVLASEVQVGEPTVDASGDATEAGGSGTGPDTEDEVRFALTAEGGMNDALAFPFVYLALRLASGWDGAEELAAWIAVDLVGRVALGVVVGLVIGRLVGVVAFRPPGPLVALAETPQGFVALATTLLAYGTTELLHGYGFVAVFVAAVALRSSERRHAFHRRLHDVVDQTENLLVVGLLLLLGAALGAGLLGPLTWRGALVAVLVVFVVRPVVAGASLVGSGLTRAERWAVSFFGIRGIGSLYYLAFALGASGEFPARALWAVVGLAVVLSIAVHGMTAGPAMTTLDREHRRRLRRRRQFQRRR